MQQLKIQYLISTGIYTALYFMIMALCLLVLRFTIPGFHNLMIPGVTALFTGLIYLILIAKVQRFGAITIMGSVIGLLFLMMGHFPLAFLPNIIAALLADVIQFKTALPIKLKTMISYTIFSYGLVGPILPLWFMRQAYIDALIARGKDQTYIHFVFEHVTKQMFAVSLVAIFIGSIIGMLIAFGLYQKHFATRFGRIYE